MLLGVDIGFTDESLARSRYARCAPYRRRITTLYSEVPEEGSDELAPYRETDVFVNMARLRSEEPQLYRSIASELRRGDDRDLWYWNESWFGPVYKDRRVKRRLKPYIEQKPSPRISLRRMPRELADELRERASEENLTNAWYDMTYDRREKICRPCPVRPLEGTNCYIRFASYPWMQRFKEGLVLAAAYADALNNEEKLKEAWFSFPHVDRKKGELPRDKLQQLYEICEGTPINKGPEVFFSAVAEMLEELKPGDFTMTGKPLGIGYTPFADEFCSKFIYRDEPYSPEEVRDLLPYLETFQEVADWGIAGTDAKPARHRMLVFDESLSSLITAFRIADKYGLEVYMSY